VGVVGCAVRKVWRAVVRVGEVSLGLISKRQVVKWMGERTIP
jgi:hypothetical protein